MWSILLLLVTNAVAPSAENTTWCGCLKASSLIRATSFQPAASITTISFELFTGTQTNFPSAVKTGSKAILPTSIDFTSAGFAGSARLNTRSWPETSVDPTRVFRSGEIVNCTRECVGPGIGCTSTLSSTSLMVAIWFTPRLPV